MLDPRIRKYNKKFMYSYAMGTYPTIDLIKYRRELVMKVLIHSKGVDSEGVKEIIDLCKKFYLKYEVADELISKIAVKENTYAVGVFEKFEDDLELDTNHIVLDQPRNMGNMGTIIRTMVGFGFKDLAIIKPAADIYDPTIVRSAMGALFQIRFSYFDSYSEYLEKFPNRNQYLTMLDGAQKVEDVKFESPLSLVLGNESSGLPADFANHGTSIYIPHSKDIDSLNLSVAAGIFMYISSLKK